MDIDLNLEQMALERNCREFAHKEILPFTSQLEDDLDFRISLFKRMAKMGFFNLTIPRTQGNHSIDNVGYSVALKSIAKVDAGIAVAMAVTNMVVEAINRYGTEEQKQKYLPRILSGDCVPASFAMTEKNAGSDAKNIQMRALADPDKPEDFILDGEKQFITNADVAGVIVVMAKTSKGITAFLVDRGLVGLSVTKKHRKLGLLTANLVDLRFDKCRVSTSAILGQEGEGLKIALASLDSGRIGIAAQALGIAEAAFEAAVQFAQQRRQFGHPIAQNQAIAFKLADMRVRLEAGRLMLYRASALKDRGKPFTIEAAMAKLFCSEISNEIAGEALQIHGGYGYIKDYPAEKYFRDARVTTLYEGTSEIQRIVISRSILESIKS